MKKTIFLAAICCILLSAKTPFSITTAAFAPSDTTITAKPCFQLGSVSFSKPLALADLVKQQNCIAVDCKSGLKMKSAEIVSYKFSHLNKAGMSEMIVNGNSLKPIRNLLKKLKVGDFVQFSEIKLKTKEGVILLNNCGAVLQ